MPDIEPTAKTGEIHFGGIGEFSIGIDSRNPVNLYQPDVFER